MIQPRLRDLGQPPDPVQRRPGLPLPTPGVGELALHPAETLAELLLLGRSRLLLPAPESLSAARRGAEPLLAALCLWAKGLSADRALLGG